MRVSNIFSNQLWSIVGDLQTFRIVRDPKLLKLSSLFLYMLGLGYLFSFHRLGFTIKMVIRFQIRKGENC